MRWDRSGSTVSRQQAARPGFDSHQKNRDFVFATEVQIDSRAQTAYFQWVSGVRSLHPPGVKDN